jgi:hypothetical protein
MEAYQPEEQAALCLRPRQQQDDGLPLVPLLLTIFPPEELIMPLIMIVF